MCPFGYTLMTGTVVPLVIHLGAKFEETTPLLRWSKRSSCPDAAAINPVTRNSIAISIQKMQSAVINLNEELNMVDQGISRNI